MNGCHMLVDPVVRCPYDRSHFIARSRLQRHIVKCEKRFPEHYKIMCPYNANHRLFKNELKEHVIACPERNVLQLELYPEPSKHGGINFDLHSEVANTIDHTENWDLEVDSNTTALTDTNTETTASAINIASKATGDSFEFMASKASKDSKTIRAPRGFSEAMLKEVNEDSCIEDQESIVSSMGIGRGKVTWSNEKLKLIGLGRGNPLNDNS